MNYFFPTPWTNSDTINCAILIVYTIMAWYMYRTFEIGFRQTKFSLAINQFGIFNDQLKQFKDEGENIRFKLNLYSENDINNFTKAVEKSNGIYYIEIFLLLSHSPNEFTESEINEVRTQILFPLTKYYNRIFKFLEDIYNDNILTDEYKIILFNNIERDILQTYFRVCNNKFGEQKTVDFNIFKTIRFIPEQSFLKINQFYIENNLFKFENLMFYEGTL